jgi:hypothetical protein
MMMNAMKVEENARAFQSGYWIGHLEGLECKVVHRNGAADVLNPWGQKLGTISPQDLGMQSALCRGDFVNRLGNIVSLAERVVRNYLGC